MCMHVSTPMCTSLLSMLSCVSTVLLSPSSLPSIGYDAVGPLTGTSTDTLIMLWFLQPHDVTAESMREIQKLARNMEVMRRQLICHDHATCSCCCCFCFCCFCCSSPRTCPCSCSYCVCPCTTRPLSVMHRSSSLQPSITSSLLTCSHGSIVCGQANKHVCPAQPCHAHHPSTAAQHSTAHHARQQPICVMPSSISVFHVALLPPL